MIEKLEALLARGDDSRELRFTLANHYLGVGDAARALGHARVAVELDADYSAAWRLLGQIHTELGEHKEAVAIYEKGIEVAELRGDIQVAREMRVFLKRLMKDTDVASERES